MTRVFFFGPKLSMSDLTRICVSAFATLNFRRCFTISTKSTYWFAQLNWCQLFRKPRRIVYYNRLEIYSLVQNFQGLTGRKVWSCLSPPLDFTVESHCKSIIYCESNNLIIVKPTHRQWYGIYCKWVETSSLVQNFGGLTCPRFVTPFPWSPLFYASFTI